MSDIDWDEFAGSDAYAKWDEVGTQVVGTVLSVTRGTDFNGEPCPQLSIEQEDGTTVGVTASQVMLMRALAEKAPSKGDRIRITYSGVGDAKPGKAPAKLFTVEVKAGDQPAPQPVATAPDEAPF